MNKNALSIFLLIIFDSFSILAVSQVHIHLEHSHHLTIPGVAITYLFGILSLNLLLYLFDTYPSQNRKSGLQLGWSILGASSISTAILPILFRSNDLNYSLFSVIIVGAISPLYLFFLRWAIWIPLLNKFGKQRILLLGDCEVISEMFCLFENHTQYQIDSLEMTPSRSLPWKEIIEIVSHNNISNICLSDLISIENDDLQYIIFLKMRGITIKNKSACYEEIHQKINLSTVQIGWFFNEKNFQTNVFDLRCKRIFDIILSALGLLILSPLVPIIWTLNLIFNPGPLIYHQIRVGYRGQNFEIYKFRSMIPNAENEGVVWASKNDQRVTLLGHWLRKTHIDELPQLWNIFCGEMSLVGPRPERPEWVEEIEKKIPFYNIRHNAKPGLTGWAQIKLLYVDSIDLTREKLEHDLYYLSRFSFVFDLAIVIQTFRNVFFAKGR